MKHNYLKRLVALFMVLSFVMIGFTACGKNTQNEGGNGDGLSDGTDSTTEESQTPDELPGTDTSDVTGEGNDIEGEDTEATTVEATVITEAQMKSMVEEALGKKVDSIYDLEYQEEVSNQLQLLQMKDIYNLDNPLFVINPYGTNRLGMYVYLNTDDDAFMEYTVSVDNQVVNDFTRHLCSEDAKAQKEHEGYVIGLVPGVTNTITVRSYDDGNAITDKYVYTVDMPESTTIEQPILDVTQEQSLEELTDGLFALFETTKNGTEKAGHILFYDNTGVVRSEIPLDNTSASSRIEFVDDNILYACSEDQFALVNETGEVEYLYTLAGYTLHHDFDYDKDEDCIIALATNQTSRTKEDCVVLLDLETGNYSELFDFAELFPDISKKAVNSATDSEEDGSGWIQLNSIQIVDTDHIIVGSRELNSVIKVDNIRENPAIAYIISDPVFWEGTPYANYILEQTGSFVNHAGEYNVTYVADDSLDDGQYYIHMYNSNYGNSDSYPDFDYTAITNVGTKDQDAQNSYYYRYLIDEEGKTYELVDSFAVPYSNVLGSTQELDGNRVVCSGSAGVFGEYDAAGNLIAEYKVNVPEDDQLYRVFKYKMDGYWFN